MVGIINWLKGYLRIRVQGVAVERFINLCGYKNILLWNVCRYDNCYEMYISLKAFWELRPIVRKTQTKVVILQRYGLPFFISDMNRRKVFLFGCIFSILFWQISAHFIWQIEIDGNYRITSEQLYDYLEEQQIHIGMLKKNLDIEKLEKELRIAFPDITWTSGKIDGTSLLLSIKEGEGIEVIPSEQSMERKDLIAQVDGEIFSIIVRSGVPMVKQGDLVTKDTVLVEGRIPVMNDDGTVREYIYVEADADVLIRHTITYEDTLLKKYVKKSYTGREKKIYYLRFGEKELTLRRNPSYLVSDVVIQEFTPQFFKDLKIPLKWGTYTYREYLNLETLYDKEKASAILQKNFVQFLSTLSEKGVQIIEKDVKIIEKSNAWAATGEIVIAEPAENLVRAEEADVVEALEKE